MNDAAEPLVYVHSAIAWALKDHGVGTLFGLIGDANLYMVDAFIREQQIERAETRSAKAPRRRDQPDARLFKVG